MDRSDDDRNLLDNAALIRLAVSRKAEPVLQGHVDGHGRPRWRIQHLLDE